MNKEAYNKVYIQRITDNNATKETIIKSKALLQSSKIDDRVIVFVAGHGIVDEKMDYYFATADVDFNNPSLRGLPYEELENLLDGIPSRKKLLLIDACHSGEIDKDETVLASATQTTDVNVKSRGFKAVKKKSTLGLTNSFELMQELFADLRRTSGAIVVASASGTEFAFETSEYKNGVFTYALLEALQLKADSNKDQHVSTTELRNYVVTRVKALTGGKQTPTARKENMLADFDIR